MKAPAFWWEDGSAASALLAPAAWIWGRVAAARMAGNGARAAVPVICIGNLVAGGAGKTPTAIAVARHLAARGRRPVFLSRGYGGTLRDATLVDPGRHTAAQCGDEPLLLARHFPVVVAADRIAGAALAGRHGDVIVMDDGLQNPSLRKDVTIAVVDGGRGIGNGRCIPAGPLRAPLDAQWPKVDALLVIGPGRAGEAVAATAAARGLPVARGRLVADAAAATRVGDREVLAFAGIGAPAKFFATLRETGAKVVEAIALPDHHDFGPGQVERFVARAEEAGLVPITTEKDAARLPAAVAAELAGRLVVLPVRLELDADVLDGLLTRIG